MIEIKKIETCAKKFRYSIIGDFAKKAKNRMSGDYRSIIVTTLIRSINIIITSSNLYKFINLDHKLLKKSYIEVESLDESKGNSSENSSNNSDV